MRWRIYYDDRAPADDSGYAPDQVSRRGVQCIVQPHPGAGSEILRLADYYWWENDRWWRGDMFGLYDYLCREHWSAVCFGRTIDPLRHEEIYRQAKSDPDFPRKSAKTRLEP